MDARSSLLLVTDLIRIGQSLGIDVAERLYLELREEPRDISGNPIDWTQIKNWIEAIK